MPRGARRSLMFGFSVLSSSSRFQLAAILHHHHNFVAETSQAQISMDKPHKDQEVVKSNGGCETNTPKPVSDNILPHILNLYGACATARDFEIYAPNATFEDPLMRAHGVKQIKSAFYSLSKVFSESKIVEYSVKETETSPGKQEILIDNKQHYKMFGKDIPMISLIKLYVDQGKVVRHEDCWDKKPLTTRETSNPLVARIVEISKRGSMMLTHALMRFGKDPTA